MTAPKFTVFSRPGCHLCEILLDELMPLVRGRATVDVVDIDTRADRVADYGTRIPVLELEGRFVCQYRLDRGAVRQALDTAIESRVAS